uniref:Uncharacterized protein n=1 Tax=Populus trichocarpa TaxID=3694 RepID=A0A3N7EB29_POPTR
MPCDFSAFDICGMVYFFFQSAFQILKTCKFSIEKHLYEAHK